MTTSTYYVEEFLEDKDTLLLFDTLEDIKVANDSLNESFPFAQEVNRYVYGHSSLLNALHIDADIKATPTDELLEYLAEFVFAAGPITNVYQNGKISGLIRVRQVLTVLDLRIAASVSKKLFLTQPAYLALQYCMTLCRSLTHDHPVDSQCVVGILPATFTFPHLTAAMVLSGDPTAAQALNTAVFNLTVFPMVSILGPKLTASQLLQRVGSIATKHDITHKHHFPSFNGHYSELVDLGKQLATLPPISTKKASTSKWKLSLSAPSIQTPPTKKLDPVPPLNPVPPSWNDIEPTTTDWKALATEVSAVAPKTGVTPEEVQELLPSTVPDTVVHKAFQKSNLFQFLENTSMQTLVEDGYHVPNWMLVAFEQKKKKELDDALLVQAGVPSPVHQFTVLSKIKKMPASKRRVLIFGRAKVGKDTLAQHLVEKYDADVISFADHMKRFVHANFGFTEEQLWGPSEFRNAVDPRFDSKNSDAWAVAVRGVTRNGRSFIRALLQVPGSPYNEQKEEQYYCSLLHWFRTLYEVPLSPRVVLQTLGTEWGRNQVSHTVWSGDVHRKVNRIFENTNVRYDRMKGLVTSSSKSPQFVVTADGRFPDEVSSYGFNVYLRRNLPEEDFQKHASEQSVFDMSKFDLVLDNNGTPEEMFEIFDKKLEERFG